MAKSQKNVPEATQDEGEQLSESYISIGLGLLVVIVVGILLYNFFQQKNTETTEESTEISEDITEEATTTAKPGGTYKVVEGDTLWSISEKSYGTGFEWERIAKENNVTSDIQLVVDQELRIPVIPPDASLLAVASTQPTTSPEAVATAVASPVASPISSPAATTAPVPPAATPTPTPTITGTSYKVVKGDTLWSIACRAYGDCFQWPKVAAANKLANPDLIFTDSTLTLPR